MIRHLVALRFRQDVSAAVKQALFDDLAALAGHIDGIIDFQSRRNVSVENHVVHGFRDLFWFDFRDTDVRNVYLADARHKAIGAQIVAECDGGVEGVLVMDFGI